MLAEYRRIIAGLNETLQMQTATFSPSPEATSFANDQMQQTNQQPERLQFTAVTGVADEADGVLGMFFGNSERSDESIDTESDPYQ